MTTEIEKIKTKINGLLSKTIGNGCTEQEALAAAQKAGELMDHYGLQLSDIEIREEKCKMRVIKTGAKKISALDYVTVTLAGFCDLKIYRSKAGYRGPIQYHVFGFEHDTEIFEYLFEVIKRAMDTSWEEYKNSDEYKNSKIHGISIRSSFQHGFTGRVNYRLKQLKEERAAELKKRQESNARSLVVLKHQVVNTEYNEYLRNEGVRLRHNSYTPKIRSSSGFDAGSKAGEKVSFNRGVSGGKATSGLLS